VGSSFYFSIPGGTPPDTPDRKEELEARRVTNAPMDELMDGTR
jgi:hypothetical protein